MSSIKVNAITDASGGNTATINSMTPTADSLQGFRNRIINGDMRIDQRNAGATVNTNNAFPVDRFEQEFSGDGVLTSKQSTDAPEGFTNSLEVKVTTIDASIGSTDFYQIVQLIEGFNVADIGLGQSWCKPMALSFWVKASQTGTYPVQLANTGGNRCYPTTITVNSANTWEYKTISVPATTSGTFSTNNNQGLGFRIGFAYGSNFDGATANSWGTFSGFADSFVTTSNNMMSTLNSTFYITGVQLEVGSVATPFERRDYGRELMLCQRYFQTLVVSTGSAAYLSSFVATSTTEGLGVTFLPVPMRAAPALAITLSGGTTKYRVNTGNTDQNSDTNPTIANATATSFRLNFTGFTGLTAGNTGWVNNRDSTAGYFGVTSEL